MHDSPVGLLNFAHARRIHDDSIIIDLLFHGPLTPDSIRKKNSGKVKKQYEPYFVDSNDNIPYTFDKKS